MPAVLNRLDCMFNAKPGIWPDVADVYSKASKILQEAGIDYVTIGGLALNELDASRPTYDVDLLVKRKDWIKAISLVRSKLSVDTLGTRFGFEDEPTAGLGISCDNGVTVEIWQEGITAGEIAKLRGKFKSHPANVVPFKMKGNKIINLLNFKLASFASARDRYKDAADVISLAHRHGLTAALSSKLHPAVRQVYLRLIKNAN